MRFYSIIFNTICVKSNEYVYVFMILYSIMLKNKTITSADEFYVMCDLDTYSTIKKIDMLKQIKLIPISKPITQTDGMKLKFFDPEATYVPCCGTPEEGHYYFTNMLSVLLR